MKFSLYEVFRICFKKGCAGTMPERSQIFCRYFQKRLNILHIAYDRLLRIMPEPCRNRAGMPGELPFKG
jgi:hypothetical protein